MLAQYTRKESPYHQNSLQESQKRTWTSEDPLFFFQDFEAFAISEETVQKYQTFEFDGLSFVLELDQFLEWNSAHKKRILNRKRQTESEKNEFSPKPMVIFRICRLRWHSNQIEGQGKGVGGWMEFCCHFPFHKPIRL